MSVGFSSGSFALEVMAVVQTPKNLKEAAVRELKLLHILSQSIVPLKKIEYDFGYITIRSPHTLYSILSRGTRM